LTPLHLTPLACRHSDRFTSASAVGEPAAAFVRAAILKRGTKSIPSVLCSNRSAVNWRSLCWRPHAAGHPLARATVPVLDRVLELWPGPGHGNEGSGHTS
jgi:hypothetical protein